MNDLDSGINSEVSKFADDTEVGRVIRTDQDASELQGDLMTGRGSGRWSLISESLVY